MPYARVNVFWPGDPEPGRSALDQRREVLGKRADQIQRGALARRATSITLPRDAGQFSKLRRHARPRPWGTVSHMPRGKSEQAK